MISRRYAHRARDLADRTLEQVAEKLIQLSFVRHFEKLLAELHEFRLAEEIRFAGRFVMLSLRVFHLRAVLIGFAVRVAHGPQSPIEKAFFRRIPFNNRASHNSLFSFGYAVYSPKSFFVLLGEILEFCEISFANERQSSLWL